MTGNGKLLKIFCIASLFVGLGTLALGIALLIPDMTDIDSCLTACEGLVATVFGVRCSILANVPSNTQKILKKALIALLAAVIVIAMFAFAGLSVTTPQYVLAGVVCAIFLVAAVLSRTIVREQLRK